MSMCRVFSCVVGRGCLLWPVCSLNKTFVSLCPASFCTPRPNLPITPGISWLFTFAFQSPMMRRTSFFFLVFVLESLVGIHQFSSVQSLSCFRLFVTPWIAAHQASLSITNSQSSLRLTSIESVGLHRLSQLQLLQHQWLAHRLWIPWCSMVCLGKNWDHSVVFEVVPT